MTDWSAIKTEIKATLKLFFPLYITYICLQGTRLTDNFFMGHLGKDQLAAAAVADSFAWGLFYIPLGLVFGLDTLVSQAYGAKNYPMIGQTFQTSIFICSLLCIPIAMVWWFSEPILLAIGVSPIVASLSRIYMRYLMLALLPYTIYRASERYLQNQKITLPTMMCNIMALFINLLLNYLFINKAKLGLKGSPIATSLTMYLQLFILWGIVIFKGHQKKSLKGIDWSAFHLTTIWSYLKVATPSAAMVFFDAMGFNMLGIFIGMLGNESFAAAHAVSWALLTFSFITPLSLSVSGATRIGNLLGEGKPIDAKRVMRLSFVLVFSILAVQSAIILLGRYLWTSIYLNDPEVSATVVKMTPLIVFLAMSDGCVTLCAGILRASGRQNVGGIGTPVFFWFVGLPLSAVLGFVAHMEIYGVWLGFAIGVFLYDVGLLVYVMRIDWVEESKLAMERTAKDQDLVEGLLLGSGSDSSSWCDSLAKPTSVVSDSSRSSSGFSSGRSSEDSLCA
eukprot:TRINITY_DN4311_c0_g3_i1.p1 TRINITY_DN4311_c0_g3~~TRINITY_DN4311_c0_g3_i1.p1  ORF type:complete len:522 (+),score=66.67 TRINITY_DN4311_c0_g3_i1:49-1566(+)